MGLLRETSSRGQQALLVYSSLAVLFVFVYLILFPRALPAELTLVPESSTVLTELSSSRLSSGGQFFVLGDRQGYWAADGRLERVGARQLHAAVSGDKIAWFDLPQSRVVVENETGALFSIAGEQYPFWVQDKLFTFDESRLGLASWGPQGQLLWRKAFSSLVTSVDATAKLTVVGTLDGRIQVFSADGTNAGGFQPGGSRLPVVYNVSLSPDNGSILVLAGVDPKRFLVLESGGSEFRPVYHKPLKEASPWPTALGFLNRGELAFYQTENGLALLDPKSPSHEVVLKTQGSPLLVQGLEGGNLIAFTEKDSERQSLRVASVNGGSLLTLPFSAQALMLKRQGSSLFVGIDQSLLRFEVRIQ